MKIKIMSVFVTDQEKALEFYTEKLGFIKKQDTPAGTHRWLTVVSPEGPDDVELLLEPSANLISQSYQESLFKQGIPIATFAVTDVRQEYEKLKALGVEFRSEPADAGTTWIAVFDDTCGNLIQIYEG